jgi:hypothetical protein
MFPPHFSPNLDWALAAMMVIEMPANFILLRRERQGKGGSQFCL